MNYEELKKKNGITDTSVKMVKIYNPSSTILAFESNEVRNYWKEIRSSEIKNIINFNLPDVREEFLKLILGDKIKNKIIRVLY